MQKFPEGVSDTDARQLCWWLYSRSYGLPQIYQPQLTMDGLADTFAGLASAGWVHAGVGPAPKSDRDHWHEVIFYMFTDPHLIDGARWTELDLLMGFEREKPAAS